jgi:hypothetical protein
MHEFDLRAPEFEFCIQEFSILTSPEHEVANFARGSKVIKLSSQKSETGPS